MNQNIKELLEILKEFSEKKESHKEKARGVKEPNTEQVIFCDMKNIECHLRACIEYVPYSFFDEPDITGKLNVIKTLIDQVINDMKKCFERSQESSGCC